MIADTINTKTKTLHYAAILTMITMMSSVLSDMFLPALPEITQYYNTIPSITQMAFSIYFLGFAVSQLIYGRLADRYGRKKTLVIGLLCGMIGSIGCIFSPTIYFLIFSRLIQSLGVGATAVISRTVARDLFVGKQLARVVSYISLFFVLAPAFAPLIGAYIQLYINWQAIFVFSLLYIVVVMLWVIVALPETLHMAIQNKKNSIFIDYLIVLKNIKFIRYCIFSTSTLAGFYSYYAIGAFVYQNVIGLSQVSYGSLALVIGVTSIVSRFINGLFLSWFSIRRLVFFGIIMMIISGTTMISLFLLGYINLWAVLLPMCIFVAGGGFIFANAYAAALHDFPGLAGTASSLYGFIQNVGAFIVLWLVTQFHTPNQSALSVVLLALALISFTVFIYLKSPKELAF